MRIRHSVCHRWTFACAKHLTGPHCQSRGYYLRKALSWRAGHLFTLVWTRVASLSPHDRTLLESKEGQAASRQHVGERTSGVTLGASRVTRRSEESAITKSTHGRVESSVNRDQPSHHPAVISKSRINPR